MGPVCPAGRGPKHVGQVVGGSDEDLPCKRRVLRQGARSSMWGIPVIMDVQGPHQHSEVGTLGCLYAIEAQRMTGNPHLTPRSPEWHLLTEV